MKRKWIVPLLAGLLLITAFVLLTSRGIGVQNTQAQMDPATTPSPEWMFEGNQGDMASVYQQMLQQDDLDPVLRESLEEKLAMAQQIQQIQSARPPEGLEGASSIRPPVEQADPAFRAGIFEGGEGLFRATQAVIENYWQDVVNGEYVQVFAGAAGEDASQGVVYVVVTTADRMNREVVGYPAPDQNGSLRIVGVENNVLTLEEQNGEGTRFDVVEREFLPLISQE